MGGEWEGESLGEGGGGGGEGSGFVGFSFILSVFSAQYPNCSRNADDFIGPYSLSLVYLKLLNVSIREPHNFLCHSPVDSILFSESACVKPKA